MASAPSTLIAGFWLGYLVHTAYSATYNSLGHAGSTTPHRTTALSITSMAFLGSASASGSLHGILAERSSSTSLVVGAVALVVAAALIVAATRSRPGSAQRA